jgi:putative transposase
VLLGQGYSIAKACKQIGVTDQTYYRWRKSYGGLKVDQTIRPGAAEIKAR